MITNNSNQIPSSFLSRNSLNTLLEIRSSHIFSSQTSCLYFKKSQLSQEFLNTSKPSLRNTLQNLHGIKISSEIISLNGQSYLLKNNLQSKSKKLTSSSTICNRWVCIRSQRQCKTSV